MKTKTFKVETFYERAHCDDCGGELKDTGIMFTSTPPLYQHKCELCGKTYELNMLYPRIFYKEIESNELEVNND